MSRPRELADWETKNPLLDKMVKAGWISRWAVRDGKYAVSFTLEGDLHAITFRKLEKNIAPTSLEMEALRRIMALNKKAYGMID